MVSVGCNAIDASPRARRFPVHRRPRDSRARSGRASDSDSTAGCRIRCDAGREYAGKRPSLACRVAVHSSLFAPEYHPGGDGSAPDSTARRRTRVRCPSRACRHAAEFRPSRCRSLQLVRSRASPGSRRKCSRQHSASPDPVRCRSRACRQSAEFRPSRCRSLRPVRSRVSPGWRRKCLRQHSTSPDPVLCRSRACRQSAEFRPSGLPFTPACLLPSITRVAPQVLPTAQRVPGPAAMPLQSMPSNRQILAGRVGTDSGHFAPGDGWWSHAASAPASTKRRWTRPHAR